MRFRLTEQRLEGTGLKAVHIIQLNITRRHFFSFLLRNFATMSSEHSELLFMILAQFCTNLLFLLHKSSRWSFFLDTLYIRCAIMIVFLLLQPNAKFILGYVHRCEHTTKLLQQTAECHQLAWQTVCGCTQLSSTHHPHIIEFTLRHTQTPT